MSQTNSTEVQNDQQQTVRLFSYGTLQQTNVQLTTFGRELVGEQDAMVGYKRSMLTITDPEVIATSGSSEHPVVLPSEVPEDRVEGTVFRITPEELIAADGYEVDDYTRISVKLESGNEAWVYVHHSAVDG